MTLNIENSKYAGLDLLVTYSLKELPKVYEKISEIKRERRVIIET